MSHRTKFAAIVGLALILEGCASTSFVSTWKNPEVAPFEKPKGQVIVAAVAAEDKYIRQGAEDALASELTKRGYKGVPSYQILPPGVTEEEPAKAAFAKIGAVGIVVMRPLAVDQELSMTSVSVYAGPYYGGYWGGYYGYGWGHPYGGTMVTSDTVLIVETLVYSLEQNKLIWSGKSKTTNPDDVAKFVRELAESAAWEINKAGVFKK
jgi:hypothetical protein